MKSTVCKETGNLTTNTTDAKLGGSPMLDLPVLLLPVVGLGVQHATDMKDFINLRRLERVNGA
jgi:hypothetical protein